MIHTYIYKLYPTITVIRGNIAYDKDENIVEYDMSLVEAEQAKESRRKDALAYLVSTDYMMTADYDKDTSAVRILRANARSILREL